MLRRRTITLLTLTGLCGLGLGALSFFEDGLYSAICLFAFPLLVALLYLVIIIDIINPPKRVSQARPSQTKVMPAASATEMVGQPRAV